ncbi:MAG: hypothetical protein EBV77_08735 [Gemmatimonadaceae bacterium]|nr:hypothetical protein [Gemmatimonadaceae bacterium]
MRRRTDSPAFTAGKRNTTASVVGVTPCTSSPARVIASPLSTSCLSESPVSRLRAYGLLTVLPARTTLM